MAKKENVRTSAGRQVMAVFDNYKAYDESTALTIKDFEKVPLSSEMIAYTFGNMIDEKVIIPVGEDRFYLDKNSFKKLEKKVNRIYWVMLLAPSVALIVFLIIMNYDKIFNWLGGIK